MQRTMLKSKIHRAFITAADLHYSGSITIDEDLLDMADMFEFERVQVVNLNTGARLETYAVAGPRGSGDVCLNGAAARMGHPGDMVIIMSFATMSVDEAKNHRPRIVKVDSNNKPIEHSSSVASHLPQVQPPRDILG